MHVLTWLLFFGFLSLYLYLLIPKLVMFIRVLSVHYFLRGYYLDTFPYGVKTFGPLGIFLVVFVSPTIEELIFRGPILLVNNWFNNPYYTLLSSIILGGLFVLLHFRFDRSLPSFLWKSIITVSYTVITLDSSSLYLAICLHAVNNAIVVVDLMSKHFTDYFGNVGKSIQNITHTPSG